MNIIADNNIYPELIGGEVWFGRICDQLAEWYVKPETRYDMIRKWEYFLKDGMSFKSLDRNVVKSKDLILSDGQTYDEFKDPFRQVAQHIWRDVQNYELKTGKPVDSFSHVNVSLWWYQHTVNLYLTALFNYKYYILFCFIFKKWKEKVKFLNLRCNCTGSDSIERR